MDAPPCRHATINTTAPTLAWPRDQCAITLKLEYIEMYKAQTKTATSRRFPRMRPKHPPRRNATSTAAKLKIEVEAWWPSFSPPPWEEDGRGDETDAILLYDDRRQQGKHRVHGLSRRGSS